MGIIADLFKGLSEVQLSTVLKERIELAEQKYEKLLQEHEPLKRRVAELEAENGQLQEQLAKPAAKLNDDTVRVLHHLFNETDEGNCHVHAMANALNMEFGVVQFQLDYLENSGLVQITGSNYISGQTYWDTTPAGRAYIVENGLK